jgi:hypothetical protein
MRTLQRCVCFAAILLALALPSGCKKKSTAPVSQPVITNNPGDFTYQDSNMQAKTGVESYAWPSTGTNVSVDQTSTIASGLITLTILDAASAQVYQHSLSDAGTFPATAGTAGTWTIRIDTAHATGRVSFHVRKI